MTLEKIISKIKEQLKDGIYPGASLALYQAGRWQEFYFGLADSQEGKATQVGLVYDLASVSKVVGVGTLAAFLYEQDKLELDLPLQHYYPAFHRQDVTLRQLLTHTSGLDPFIPNRDQLTAPELKAALNHLTVLEDKTFRYTDVNFLLLGFMLEEIYGQSLDQIFQSQIFQPWGLAETGFGPVPGAVLTVRGVQDGQVHDPKARVLGIHAGSAGLFSTLRDLEVFLEHYLQDDFADHLTQNFSKEPGKRRSLAWNLEGSWLDHTGYTGTFIMYNRKEQKAAIFLSNRTYEKDERAQWILDRNQLMDLIRIEL
ncbi:D-alanyl-D-alanine carboxypeptidase precursor [Streptococcus sanguinis]|uniref:serine hydrolase domain-containing protein n=1 Tax=Streptococcus sanguinis TaxID=1305 RepID=UPI000F691CCE|nr:serine hydrolase domain-containing protein [Streptococcus sanguinis]RSI28985.1 D-alanyl-D-alanine carboxypeptidase precursor [Streptococcus sanguinis]